MVYVDTKTQVWNNEIRSAWDVVVQSVTLFTCTLFFTCVIVYLCGCVMLSYLYPHIQFKTVHGYWLMKMTNSYKNMSNTIKYIYTKQTYSETLYRNIYTVQHLQ